MIIGSLEQRVSTAAVWSIASGGKNYEPCTWGDCGKVYQQIFPGIAYRSSIDKMNVDALARYHLRQYYRQNKEFTIVDCETDSQAVLIFGNDINVPALKRCNGNEWKSWLQDIPARELKSHSEAYAKMMLARESIHKNSPGAN